MTEYEEKLLSSLENDLEVLLDYGEFVVYKNVGIDEAKLKKDLKKALKDVRKGKADKIFSGEYDDDYL